MELVLSIPKFFGVLARGFCSGTPRNFPQAAGEGYEKMAVNCKIDGKMRVPANEGQNVTLRLVLGPYL